MRTSETHTSANAALREATQALNVRRVGTTEADLTETAYKTPATDLAANLDTVASLLRSVGVGVRHHAPTPGLLTVAEHVDLGASMAPQAGVDHDCQPQTTTHLDPERGATDDVTQDD
ncbi:hypothetical protein PHK61_15580 [Actinomycetospora lutea]|uniref:hypothetical protein n=1 Tax=Actinomycetospora lutea TaxID=663604 RepID=UPI0023669ED3|nr:hypothetical protein [Actinomycetospora lutea]MDD7939842.1 hypothetical protein [Actinomycetospora lutea]